MWSGKSCRTLLAGVMALSACGAIQAQSKITLIEISKAWGSAIADFNNDGHDDIYITGHDPNDRIWYWTRKGYKPSKQGLELPVHSDRHDCAPSDVNRDGRVDFYCTVGAGKGSGSGNNELWIQMDSGKHRMVGATSDFGAKDPTGRGRRTLFFDMNRDGYPDIFLTNLGEPREDGLPNVNRVFLNQGGVSFQEVTTAATGIFGGACVAKGDVNQDGWEDIVVCSDIGPAHIFINTQTNDFVELTPPGTAAQLGLKAPTKGFAKRIIPQDIQEGFWIDAKLADVDGDGKDDLLVLTRFSNRFQIWKNSGSGNYFETTLLDEALPGIGASIAVADFNRDGFKDVYVVLQDPLCEDSLKDLAPDLLYEGRGNGTFVATQLDQNFAGCGHLADVVDGDKLLLMNGGGGWVGPNYLLEFDTRSPTSAAPRKAARK